MSSTDEVVDVLVIGAGFAGAVAALRLVEAGFSVTCLEQGDWTNRFDYPGSSDAWELLAAKQWSPAPHVRDRPGDYPIDLTASDVGVLNFNGVGGGGVLYGGQWPRMRPDDFRVRSVDGVADNWPIGYDDLQPYYEETDRQLGVSGLGGNPAYPAGEDPPMPPSLSAQPGCSSPAPTPDLVGTGGLGRRPSPLPRTAGETHVYSAAPACRAATRGPRRRPTSRTGRSSWPQVASF